MRAQIPESHFPGSFRHHFHPTLSFGCHPGRNRGPRFAIRVVDRYPACASHPDSVGTVETPGRWNARTMERTPVTVFPRVALCATFTIASLAGAVLVAKSAAAPRPQPPVIENTFWPDAETEERVHRVALRQETIDDLMNGQVTLEAAVERFWDLSTGSEGALISLRNTIPGETDEQRVVNQVLTFAKVHASKEPGRFDTRLAQLRAEAHSFEFKPVVLQ